MAQPSSSESGRNHPKVDDERSTRLTYWMIRGIRDLLWNVVRDRIADQEGTAFTELGKAADARELENCHELVQKLIQIRRRPERVCEDFVGQLVDDYCESLVDAQTDKQFYEAARQVMQIESVDVVQYLLHELSDDVERFGADD